jgi:hypothetical protein
MIKLILSTVLLSLTVAASGNAEVPSSSMDKYGNIYEDIRNGRVLQFTVEEEETYEIFDADHAEDLLQNFENNQSDSQEPEDKTKIDQNNLDSNQDSGN